MRPAISYFAQYDYEGVQGTIVFFNNAPSQKFPGADPDAFAEHLTECVKQFAAFSGASARTETTNKDPNAN